MNDKWIIPPGRLETEAWDAEHDVYRQRPAKLPFWKRLWRWNRHPGPHEQAEQRDRQVGRMNEDF